MEEVHLGEVWQFENNIADLISLCKEVLSDNPLFFLINSSILLDFKKRWSTSIYRISYNYSPESDVEVLYNIIFSNEVKNTNYASKILSKINKEIIALGEDVTKNLNFDIKYDYQKTGCLPCQKAKERGD